MIKRNYLKNKEKKGEKEDNNLKKEKKINFNFRYLI